MPQHTTIRILSWNILAARGWRPGEHPVHSPGPRRADVMPAIAGTIRRHNPDIVALQECPSRKDTAVLADALGMTLAWFDSGWQGNAQWPGGFPGAILSAHPMQDIRDERAMAIDLPEACFKRHWGSALIHSPIGPVRVHAYHCCADWDGQCHDSVREAELTAVVRTLDSLPLAILIGDHNARPVEPPLRVLAQHALIDAHAHAGQGDGYTDPADHPTQRIDQCWVRGLRPCRCQVIHGPDIYTGHGDDGFYLSDHAALCVDLAAD